jgi:transcription elongation factor GreA
VGILFWVKKEKTMADEKIYVTQDGLKELQDEYDYLVDVRRKEVAEKLKSARELGDITENAAYEAAKDEQSFIEGRVKELEALLEKIEVVEGEKADKVAIGSRVKVRLEADEQEFHIVGTTETDPASGRISHKSPLGQALIGKAIGDKIEVDAPVGKLTYCILEIR